MSLARLLDEITAAVPDRAALITDGDTVTTYAELEGAVSSCACGGAPGDCRSMTRAEGPLRSIVA